MPQITPEESKFAEEQKADLQAWIDKKTDKGFRARAESDPALIDELLKRWEEGEPFYISAVVVAPYDGCFHEPNIFLCTPPGCELFDEMNRHDVDGDRIVWQLYSSGQGMCVDCLVSLPDLVRWLADQSISELATRESGKTSRHRRNHYGSFDSFELHDFGPIDKLPPRETYWATAVRAAEEHYGVALPWTCVQCETVRLGTGEHMMEPIHTGYSGNGGVGVFMHGALCYECYQRGVCYTCEERGGEPWDIYSPEVAEHGADLCDGCTYDLFRYAVTHEKGWNAKLEAEKLVRIVLEGDSLTVRREGKRGAPMKGIHIDFAAVDKVMGEMRLRPEQVFGGSGKAVLASSLAHISEEVSEEEDQA